MESRNAPGRVLWSKIFIRLFLTLFTGFPMKCSKGQSMAECTNSNIITCISQEINIQSTPPPGINDQDFMDIICRANAKATKCLNGLYCEGEQEVSVLEGFKDSFAYQCHADNKAVFARNLPCYRKIQVDKILKECEKSRFDVADFSDEAFCRAQGDWLACVRQKFEESSDICADEGTDAYMASLILTTQDAVKPFNCVLRIDGSSAYNEEETTKKAPTDERKTSLSTSADEPGSSGQNRTNPLLPNGQDFGTINSSATDVTLLVDSKEKIISYRKLQHESEALNKSNVMNILKKISRQSFESEINCTEHILTISNEYAMAFHHQLAENETKTHNQSNLFIIRTSEFTKQFIVPEIETFPIGCSFPMNAHNLLINEMSGLLQSPPSLSEDCIRDLNSPAVFTSTLLCLLGGAPIGVRDADNLPNQACRMQPYIHVCIDEMCKEAKQCQTHDTEEFSVICQRANKHLTDKSSSLLLQLEKCPEIIEHSSSLVDSEKFAGDVDLNENTKGDTTSVKTANSGNNSGTSCPLFIALLFLTIAGCWQ